jgi:hypothetical protein
LIYQHQQAGPFGEMTLVTPRIDSRALILESGAQSTDVDLAVRLAEIFSAYVVLGCKQRASEVAQWHTFRPEAGDPPV